MPYTSVALAVQYLNVPQSKLGTIIKLSTSNNMIVRTQGHCQGGVFACQLNITSKKPSPALVVLLRLCTYRLETP
jgi:hypothetical protein